MASPEIKKKGTRERRHPGGDGGGGHGKSRVNATRAMIALVRRGVMTMIAFSTAAAAAVDDATRVKNV